jgi:hypothetical protein
MIGLWGTMNQERMNTTSIPTKEAIFICFASNIYFTYFNITFFLQLQTNKFKLFFLFLYNDIQSKNYFEIIFNTSQVLKLKKRKI